MSFSEQDNDFITFLTDHKRNFQPESRLSQVHQKLIEEILDFAEKVRIKKKELLEKSSFQFFNSFKVVIEKMLEEFSLLQKRFDEYANYYENEAQSLAMTNKLSFFRDQCQILNNLCKEQKQEISIMKAKNLELENENFTQGKLLRKFENEKQSLNKQINQLFANQRSMTQPKEQKLLNNTMDNSLLPKQTQPIYKKHRKSKQQTDYSHFIVQIQNASSEERAKEIIDNLVMEVSEKCSSRVVYVYNTETDHNLDNNDLLSLWKNCVVDAQKVMTSRKSNKLSVLEKVGILTNFLQNESLQKSIESLLFKQKCCNNTDCIFNSFAQKRNHTSQQDTEIIDDLTFSKNRIKIYSQERQSPNRINHFRKFQTNIENSTGQNMILSQYRIQLAELKKQEQLLSEIKNTRSENYTRLKKSIYGTKEKLKTINRQIRQSSSNDYSSFI